MNRWVEYRAGTLTPPVVVQRDTALDGSAMLWVWDGESIIGPVSRKSDADDAAVSVEVKNVVKDRPALRDVIEDLRDTIRDLRDTIRDLRDTIRDLRDTIDEKNARIDALQATVSEKNATIAQKNARIDALLARIAELENP